MTLVLVVAGVASYGFAGVLMARALAARGEIDIDADDEVAFAVFVWPVLALMAAVIAGGRVVARFVRGGDDG